MVFMGVEEFIQGLVSGLPTGTFPLLIAALIILVSFAISFIALFILDVVDHIAKTRTKTTLDDKVLHSIRLPVRLIFLVGGFYAAFIYVNSNAAFQGYTVHQIFYIFFVLSGALLVVRILEALFAWYIEEVAIKTNTKVDKTLAPLINKFIIAAVYVIAIIMVLAELGVEITPLIASLGIAGLAVALALQDTLSNLFSGIYMGADKIIEVGDYIEMENGIKGNVENIGWRSTRIRMVSDNYVIIPNKKLAESVIINYTDPNPCLSIIVKASVAYSSDLDNVEKITVETAKSVLKRTGKEIEGRDPYVRYEEMGESGIKLSVYMFAARNANTYSVTHEFIKELMKAYRKNGITIPFPQMDVWMRNKPEKS
jgi:small-conductance mechanosensitive channel